MTMADFNVAAYLLLFQAGDDDKCIDCGKTKCICGDDDE